MDEVKNFAANNLLQVGECSHVMAFAASTDKVIVESASDSKDSSDDEVPKKLTLRKPIISYALNS